MEGVKAENRHEYLMAKFGQYTKHFCKKKVPQCSIYKTISLIEAGQAYKDGTKSRLTAKTESTAGDRGETETFLDQSRPTSPYLQLWGHMQLSNGFIQYES